MPRKSKASKSYPYKTANQGKRVILVFGPPGAGTTSVIDTLNRASTTPIVVIHYVSKDVLPVIEEALQNVDIVYLDVDGGIISSDDIQGLVDAGLLGHGLGACIRIHLDNDEILKRNSGRPDYITLDDLKLWNTACVELEATIRAHSLAYFMISNYDLETAVIQLALRSGINA